jgi:branched-chain amino acid transport system permease protein
MPSATAPLAAQSCTPAPLVVLTVTLAAILIVPLLPAGQTYPMRLATQCALLMGLAASWNLVGGLIGYPSFATAAFFGLGAYTAGVLPQAGWSTWAGLAGAITLATLLAAPLGFSILRLRGHYFAIASLMLVSILREVTTGWDALNGGGMGLNVPGAAANPETTARFALQLTLALAGVAVALSALGSRSWLVFGLACIRMNETAAAGAGVDAARLKTVAFTLSAAIAGAAGAMYGSWIGYIDPTDVSDVMWSVRPIVATLIGGVGTIFGPMIGTLVYVLLEEVLWRNLLSFGTGALGIFVIVLPLVAPTGIMPSLLRLRPA